MERQNNVELCQACGAEMTMAPDAVVNDCAACGHRLLGPQTPPVEGLNNLCRSCRHPLSPEHDDFGCHIAGCSCSVNGAVAMDEIAAVMPNAAGAERKNGYPAGFFKRNDEALRERADGVGIEDIEDEDLTPAGLKAKLEALEEGHGDPDIIAGIKAKLGLRNAAGADLAKKLGVKHPKDLPFDQPNQFGCNECDDIKAPLNVEGYCKRCAQGQGEYRNAAPTPEGLWNFASYSQLCSILESAGLDPDLAHTMWSALPPDVQKKVTPGLMRIQNENAGEPDYKHAQLVTLWAKEGDAWLKANPQMQDLASFDGSGRAGPWGAQGTDIRESFAMAKGLKNAAPDFKAAMAAFEAHCSSCAQCKKVEAAPAGAPEREASNLCATGSQLLVADLENADGSHAEDQFKKGDRVKTIEGHDGVVTYAYGAEVLVQLDADSPGPTRYHPSKVFKNAENTNAYSAEQMRAEALKLLSGSDNIYSAGAALRSKFHGATDAEVSLAIREAYDAWKLENGDPADDVENAGLGQSEPDMTSARESAGASRYGARA